MRRSKSVNVEVKLRPGENSDKLIKRFLKKCKKTEIIKEYLEKVSFFRSPSEKRKQKRAKNKHLRLKDLKKDQKLNNNFSFWIFVKIFISNLVY